MGDLLKKGLLDQVAEQNRAYISSLRLVPHLKWAALRSLYCWKRKEQFPLTEWSEAVSYLLGCEVRFESYDEIEKSLKPFSLEME